MVMDRCRGDDMGAAPMRQLHREACLIDEKRGTGQISGEGEQALTRSFAPVTPISNLVILRFARSSDLSLFFPHVPLFSSRRYPDT
jgi:hypothetical protein